MKCLRGFDKREKIFLFLLIFLSTVAQFRQKNHFPFYYQELYSYLHDARKIEYYIQEENFPERNWNLPIPFQYPFHQKFRLLTTIQFPYGYCRDQSSREFCARQTKKLLFSQLSFLNKMYCQIGWGNEFPKKGVLVARKLREEKTFLKPFLFLNETQETKVPFEFDNCNKGLRYFSP